jgi:5-carboxymethyl-2-hydroxymuconate isomerase
VADNLDGAVLALMLDHRVLDKVEQGDNFVHRALKLLQFCRSDALTKGKTQKVVRERAQSYLTQPRFLALYTADAKSDTDREKLLRDLQSLMADAGLL